MSERKFLNGNDNLLIYFNDTAPFFNTLTDVDIFTYLKNVPSLDVVVFRDTQNAHFHRGLENLTSNVDETVVYINNIIQQHNYTKVVFMGVSAGGYAAILFGSLCVKCDAVFGFVPQTILNNPIDTRYADLKNVITNFNLPYLLVVDERCSHNAMPLNCGTHSTRLKDLKNVRLLHFNPFNMSKMLYEQIIDMLIFEALRGDYFVV
jgi:hypothetical protein